MGTRNYPQTGGATAVTTVTRRRVGGHMRKRKARRGRSLTTKIKKTLISLGERKFFETVNASATNIDWNGTIISLADIPQGDGDNNRDGDQVLPTSMQYSFFVKGPTGANVPTVLRMVIFKWKPFYADVAPTPGKVLLYTGTYYSAHAGLVHDGREQFTVVSDEVVVLDDTNVRNTLLRGTAKLSGKIQWKAASTSNGAGSYYVCFMSDSVAAGGVYAILADYAVRINFNDS